MTIAEKLVKELRSKNKKVLLPSSGTELRTRCPYCGDSRKNSTSAHMYVSLLPPFMFHCFRCETSGVLNSKVLNDFDLNDPTLQLDILESNKNYRTKAGRKTRVSSNIKNNICDYSAAKRGIEYLNARFGGKYTFKDIEYLKNTYKVILDPLTFLKENNVKTDKLIFNFNESIGFISQDKTYAIFRNISKQPSKMRYINVPLLGIDSVSKMYILGNKINVLNEKSHFILTEGIFDIIGVYEQFYKNNTNNEENYIFVASCGKSYRSSIDTLIRLGFLDFDVTIYSDNDVDLTFYKDLKYNSSYLKTQNITIYYNKLSKDFGNPVTGIELRKAVV